MKPIQLSSRILLTVVLCFGWGISPSKAQRLAQLPRNAAEVREQKIDTVVICPADFRETLEPWIEYRERQGHQIAVVPSGLQASQIRASLLPYRDLGSLESILIVGDTPPQLKEKSPAVDRASAGAANQKLLKRFVDHYVPTFQIAAKVNVKFGSEPEIASDLGYADLDNDQVPEVAIGRLPVDTPEQLTQWIRRLIVYENRRALDYAGRRVGIVAGPGDFGALADSVLEMTAKKFIRAGIPSAYEIDTIYMNADSPYCPDPSRLSETTLNQINHGGLFWVYIGHGQSWYLHPMFHDNTWFPCFDNRNARDLNCRSQAPIAVFFSCYSGEFDGEHDCLAEAMTLADGGPIAALCASRVAMPYAMSLMADSLLGEHFQNHPGTLGRLVLNAKRASLQPIEDQADRRAWMHSLAKLFSPTRDQLHDEVLENSAVFNLIGDPLMRLPSPETVELEVPQRASAGSTVRVQGKLPQEGRVTLELVYRRDRQLYDSATRGKSSLSPEEWQDNYRLANERTCRYVIADLPAGDFERELFVPTFARGACHIRVFVQHATGYALGSEDIYIQPLKN